MSPSQPDHHDPQIVQAVVRYLLSTGDLAQLCRDAGVPVLTDATGSPVTIAAAHDYAGNTVFPSATFGVVVELSDGSIVDLGITIRRSATVGRHPASSSGDRPRPPRRGTR